MSEAEREDHVAVVLRAAAAAYQSAAGADYTPPRREQPASTAMRGTVVCVLIARIFGAVTASKKILFVQALPARAGLIATLLA